MEFRAVQVGENMEVLGGWCVQKVQECSTSWCKFCCGWRGLIMGNRSCVSPLITQEIPRVSGTPCQELSTKTKYLFFIIAHQVKVIFLMKLVLFTLPHSTILSFPQSWGWMSSATCQSYWFYCWFSHSREISVIISNAKQQKVYWEY